MSVEKPGLDPTELLLQIVRDTNDRVRETGAHISELRATVEQHVSDDSKIHLTLTKLVERQETRWRMLGKVSASAGGVVTAVIAGITKLKGMW